MTVKGQTAAVAEGMKERGSGRKGAGRTQRTVAAREGCLDAMEVIYKIQNSALEAGGVRREASWTCCSLENSIMAGSKSTHCLAAIKAI